RLPAQVGALRRDLARRDRFTEISGTSAAIAEVFRLMARAAASPITALIEGETGTGNAPGARRIHRARERAGGPFRPANCAPRPGSRRSVPAGNPSLSLPTAFALPRPSATESAAPGSSLRRSRS